MNTGNFTKTLLSAVIAATLVPAAVLAAQGPSSSATPYLTAVASGVEFTSILTVGDSVPKKHKGNESYRMVGIPDGLGAYDNGDGTITLLMNHELNSTAGVARAHGGNGAFVSKWQIRKRDLKVLNGEDLINTVYLWNGSGFVETPNVVFNRFCAADLPKQTAFFNPETGLGFSDGRIFMNGEESGPQGRAFAHVIQGRGNSATYELAALGRFSWENAVASPHTQDKTIVAGLDDGTLNASKVYFYVGHKQAEGNPVEQAGLTNGTNYLMAIDGFTTEGSVGGSTPIPNGHVGRFTLTTAGGTGFNRVEDGAWDTRNPNVFYFVTTASFTGNSRLWQVTFDDITNPTVGGTIKVLLDGAVRGPKMMDNLTIDRDGNLIIQEDPGNQAYLAKIWSYTPATDTLVELAQHDPARFTPGLSDFTQDEESSGVIEVSKLFRDVRGYDTDKFRYFLLDAQAHTPAGDAELVERGQLLMMKVPRNERDGHHGHDRNDRDEHDKD